MGVRVNWEIYDPKPQKLEGAYSTFIDAMQRAGYPYPCVLGPKDIPVLRRMASCYEGDTLAFRTLIELIETHGRIRLSCEY